MLTDWNFWFSVITAVVAIIALIQTKQQIRLSNKQHLFDKRVEHYLIAKGFLQLYESHQSILRFKEDKPIFAIDSIFAFMTNNVYLEKITEVISHTLEQPFHKDFLIKIEEIKDVSVQIKFMFSGRAATLLGDYVFSYQELLFKMYQYKILLNNMDETTKKINMTLERAQEAVGEKNYREDLQKAIDKLRHIYDEIKVGDIEKKIEKQIKLK